MNAAVDSHASHYRETYERSMEDPAGFWAEAARAIDWTKVTPHQIEMAAEMMFKIAGVPPEAQAAYWRAFHQYIYSVHP